MPKAKSSRPSTDRRSKRWKAPSQRASAYDRTVGYLQDVVGQISYEISVIESLANAAFGISARTGNDQICRRRLSDLVIQIEIAAREALDTTEALGAKIKGEVG